MKTISVMCSTCGIEYDAASKEEADRKHQDGAHEPHWYEDGDINKPVW